MFAAASLTDVLPAIDNGPTYSFGSSGTLRRRSRTARRRTCSWRPRRHSRRTLYAQGRVQKPINFTRNKLVIVVPKSNPAGIKSIYDLTKPGIKIVVAGPTVPVGSYTLQILKNMNLTAG